MLEKKSEIARADAQDNAGLKKKMDFYDSVFNGTAGDPEDELPKPRKNSQSKANAEPESQNDTNTNAQPEVPGISNHSKNISKDEVIKVSAHPAPEWLQKPQRERKPTRTEYKQKKEARWAERTQKLDARQKRFQKMNSKTSRGQPLMKNVMEDLYKKIRADKIATKQPQK
jgi:hypothetical protein